MKKGILALLTLALMLTLAACGQAPEVPAVSEETAGLQETEAEPSGFDSNMEVRREPMEISLHPFTQEELDRAQELVEKFLDEIAREPGTLTYQVERIAYDPIMTDVHVRQKMAGAPVDGLLGRDYYARQISFAVTYSATYDHEKTFMQDVSHEVMGVHLGRENEEAPWEYESHGVPVERYSGQAMSAQELQELPDTGGRALAGYEIDGEGYWLYLWDEQVGGPSLLMKEAPEETQREETEPVFTEPPIEETGPKPVWDESTYQSGTPVSPQPGDTKDTWNPDLAENYPADEDCTDLELLEKWLAVEDLTIDDLEERGCSQLVLAAAQETDGVQTITVCYQKQADGSWCAAKGRMQGWTGSNGIMHGRRRNSNTSPAGLWSLGLAFGNSPKPVGLKMPWRDVTPDSDWVCDENSIYFNTWQERGDPGITEAWSDDVEHLEDYPSAYAYACVIRFNTPPYNIPERGCAIFFHCSKGATAGCIGLPRADMVDTLLWLDPAQNPYILITGCQKETD